MNQSYKGGRWVGGWVGGWEGDSELHRRKKGTGTNVNEWVGGWVGGWTYPCSLLLGPTRVEGNWEGSGVLPKGSGWVGGWVGG